MVAFSEFWVYRCVLLVWNSIYRSCCYFFTTNSFQTQNIIINSIGNYMHQITFYLVHHIRLSFSTDSSLKEVKLRKNCVVCHNHKQNTRIFLWFSLKYLVPRHKTLYILQWKWTMIYLPLDAQQQNLPKLFIIQIFYKVYSPVYFFPDYVC